MKIGITGHQRLAEDAQWQWVETEMEKALRAVSEPITGLTSLAIGADQLFARLILKLHGKLEVIVPFHGYELNFTEGKERIDYFKLLEQAETVEYLTKLHTNNESYYLAGKLLVDRSDWLIAVWNGKPAAGLGGTGDIVNYANQQEKSILHINPVLYSVTHPSKI